MDFISAFVLQIVGLFCANNALNEVAGGIPTSIERLVCNMGGNLGGNPCCFVFQLISSGDPVDLIMVRFTTVMTHLTQFF